MSNKPMTKEQEELNNKHQLPEWKLIDHSYQIADTGDYDGHYEISNGKISIFSKDDDEEALQPIVDALNDSGARFYLDDSKEMFLQSENESLKQRVKELEGRLSSYFKSLDGQCPDCEFGQMHQEGYTSPNGTTKYKCDRCGHEETFP